MTPTRLVLAIAGTALIGSSDTGMTVSLATRLTGVQAFSVAAGRVLGAAAQCGEVSGDRIDDAANSIGAVVDRMSSNPDERASAHRMLLRGVAQGGDAVDCRRADAALAEVVSALSEER